MPANAKLLGYLGLIPFITIPIAVMFEVLSFPQAFAFFTQYSAIILSFLGGIHWYAAITDNGPKHQIYAAMLPSIIGWLALIGFADVRTLGILAVAHVAVVFYDKFTLQMSPQLIVDYTRLRVQLTTVVVVCHAAMVWIQP